VTVIKSLPVVFAVTFGFVALSDPANACRASGGTGIAGQVVTSTMSLEQGKSCMMRHTTTLSDAIGNRVIPNSDLTVTARPALGSVEISGNRVIYRSRAGARGNDSFVYRSRIKSGKTFDYRVVVEIY
jgi:hypothetical protein